MNLAFAVVLAANLQAGNASRYGYKGDAWNAENTFACEGTIRARYGDRTWKAMRSAGVAHRTLPCGSSVGVCNLRTGLCTSAFVVDRGPYGAVDRTGAWHVRSAQLLPGEHYRGHLDLLPAVYAAIALTGIGPIAYWQLLPAPAPTRRAKPPNA